MSALLRIVPLCPMSACVQRHPSGSPLRQDSVLHRRSALLRYTSRMPGVTLGLLLPQPLATLPAPLHATKAFTPSHPMQPSPFRDVSRRRCAGPGQPRDPNITSGSLIHHLTPLISRLHPTVGTLEEDMQRNRSHSSPPQSPGPSSPHHHSSSSRHLTSSPS